MPGFDRLYCHGCEHTSLVSAGARRCPECEGEFVEVILENEGLETSDTEPEGLTWDATYGDGDEDHETDSPMPDDDPPEVDISQSNLRGEGAPAVNTSSDRPSNILRTNQSSFPGHLGRQVAAGTAPNDPATVMAGAFPPPNQSHFRGPLASWTLPQPPTEHPGSIMGEGGAWGGRMDGRRLGQPRSHPGSPPRQASTFAWGMTMSSTTNGRTTTRTYGNRASMQPHDSSPQQGPPQLQDFARYAFHHPAIGSVRPTIADIQPRSIIHNMISGMATGQQAQTHSPDGRSPLQPGGPPFGINPFLHQIFGIPPTGYPGDAVFSEEALQRFAEGLRPPPISHATPPEIIACLPTRKVDRSLLGENGKVDCTVCLDDCPIGTEVVFLPCQHWFHRACTELWLKEHDTCPICRANVADAEPAAVPPARSSSSPPVADLSHSSSRGAGATASPTQHGRRMSRRSGLQGISATSPWGTTGRNLESSEDAPGTSSDLRPRVGRRDSQPPAGTNQRDLSPDVQESMAYQRQIRREEEGGRSRFRRFWGR